MQQQQDQPSLITRANNVNLSSMSEWSESSSQKKLVANLPKIVITYHDTDNILQRQTDTREEATSEDKRQYTEDYWADVKTGHEHFVSKPQRKEDSEMKIDDIDQMFGPNKTLSLNFRK